MSTISRAFLELGANTEGLKRGLEEAVKIAESNGAKLSSAGKSMVTNFENALNPTKALATQLEALEKSGKSAGEIHSVLGDKIKYASEQATKHGQAIDPLVAKHYDAVKSGEKFKFTTEDLGKSLSDFAANPLQAAQRGMVGLVEKMGPTATGSLALATGIGAAATAIFKLASAGADEVEHLENLSSQTGISTQMLQALAQVASEAGLQSLDLGRTIGKLNEELGRGKGEFVDALNRMGIAMTDIATGKPKDALSLLDELRNELLAIEDPAERAQAAQGALGGRLRELIPLLLNSRDGLKESAQAAIDAGIAYDDAAKEGLKEFDKAMDSLSRHWSAFMTGMKTEAGKTFTQTAKEFKAIGDAAGWFWEKINLLGQKIGIVSPQIADQAEQTRKLNKETQEAKEFTTYFAFTEETLTDIAKEAQNEIRKQHEEQKRLNDQMQKWKDEAYAKGFDDLLPGLAAALNKMPPLISSMETLNSSMAQMRGEINEGLDYSIDNLNDGFGELSISTDGLSKDLGAMMSDSTVAAEAWADEQIAAAKKSGSAFGGFGTEVSTVLTNLSQELAQKVTGWAGPFQSFASKALASLVEGLFSPVTKYLNKLGKELGDWMTGLLGGESDGFQWPSLGNGNKDGNSDTGNTGSSGGLGGAGKYVGAGLEGIAGVSSIIAGLRQGGWSGAAGVIGGATMTGAAIGSVVPGIGTAVGALVGAIWSSVGLGIGNLVAGPNSYEALSKEVRRDLGVSISDKEIKAFMDSMGISESKAWGHRVEIEQSPMFMAYLMAMGESPSTKWEAMGYGLNMAKSTGHWGPYNDIYGNWVGNELKLNEATVPWRNMLIAGATYPQDYTSNLPAYERGTSYVPEDGLAYLHKGEAVIPASQNGQRVVQIMGPIYGYDDFVQKVNEAFAVMGRVGAYA